MIFENNTITICFLLLIITVAVICDCGSPALPIDAGVYINSEPTNSLDLRNAENTELTTDCINDETVDRGVWRQVIKCQQSAWNASIHRCGKNICIK
jgi:hypothetical protein